MSVPLQVNVKSSQFGIQFGIQSIDSNYGLAPGFQIGPQIYLSSSNISTNNSLHLNYNFNHNQPPLPLFFNLFQQQ